jgi:predicted amidohydrolase YtcJ
MRRLARAVAPMHNARMRANRRFVLGSLAAMPLAGRALAQPSRITVFEARRIVTMEPAQPAARFVAVADGIILGLAQRLEDLAAWTHGRPTEIDRRFAGQVLMPGLIDPHVHPVMAAVMLNMPYIAPDDWELPSGTYPGTQTQDGWRARLRHELTRSDARPFICWGYHQLFHGPLDRAVLDQIAPDRPVVVWQRSFHDIIVNTATLRLWGLDNRERFAAALTAAKADPHDSDFDRGLFSETGLPIALARLRPELLAPQKIVAGMAALQRMMLKSGVTTVSDMGTGTFADFAAEAGLIRTAFERPDNPSRVMLMMQAHQFAAEADPGALFAELQQAWSSPHVRVDKRVKLFADGAFFALNMRMNPPGYSDGHVGKWLFPPAEMKRLAERFWNAGFSLHIHVNGDEGLDAVLDMAGALDSRRRQTITLEHLGYSTEAQNRQIARLGLMVSAQPNYIRVLGDAYGRVGLGADRAAAINRLGSLEAKGVPLGLHSDFNMAPIDPLYLAWIAANRVTIEGQVKAPAERLSLDKALRAVTIEAAQVIGIDAIAGSLAPGKKADFAVLDRDPYAAGAARLDRIGVAGVVFEGQHYLA